MSDKLSVSQIDPLKYPPISIGHSFTNILLIDKRILDCLVFVESANAQTFTILFSMLSSQDELTTLLQTYFTQIDRLAICFSTINEVANIKNYFFNDSPYFNTNDITIPFNTDSTQYSTNIAYLINIINSFQIKNIDFLGCNTLLYDSWSKYYNILTQSTSVIVGASNDATGNIKYGGDWIMETTSENVETIYFTSNIQYYKYLLDYSTEYGRNTPAFTTIVAIKSDGRALVWGSSSHGGVPSAAVLEKLNSGVVSVVTNGPSFTALKSDGTIVRWSNDGSDISPNITNAVSIKQNAFGFCALLADGSLYGTWSGNWKVNDTIAPLIASNVQDYFLGDYAMAVIKTDGSVISWGGIGTVPAILSVPNPEIPFVHISVGWFGFAALRADGMVVAWGVDGFGMGAPPSSLSDALSSGCRAIVCTERARAVLKSDGSVVAWGASANYGSDVTSPVDVSSQLTSGVIAIYATLNYFIALKSDGTVVSWGHTGSSNNAAQMTDIVQIATTNVSWAALKSDGTIAGGYNFNFTNGGVPVPTDVFITSIIATSQQGYAGKTSTGGVVTWNTNNSHNSNLIPQITNVVSFAVTTTSFAALTSAGKVYTWAGSAPDAVSAPLLTSGVVSIFPQPNVTRIFSAIPDLDYQTSRTITDSVPTNVTPDANTGITDITIDPTILTTGTETEKSQKRQIFLERLFTNNTGLASSPNKIKMTKEELLGTSSTIPKANLVIKKADNTNTPVALDNLSQDEGVYVYMGSGDFTVFNTSAGLLKILKRTDTTYDIYENYVDSTSSVTKQMIIGESSSFGTFNYTIGSVTGYTGGGAPVPICFPKGTPVNTDQGNIDIEKLNPDIHTIRGKKIVAITQTTLSSRVKHIVSIERGAFGLNTPSATTHISKDHKLLYNDNLVAAKDLVDICEGVTLIPYYGEILYNVLMEQQDYMVINNLLCETLNPNHIMAIICGGKYDNTEQNLLCEKLSTIITNNDLDGYTDLCKQLHRTPFQ